MSEMKQQTKNEQHITTQKQLAWNHIKSLFGSLIELLLAMSWMLSVPGSLFSLSFFKC